MVCNLAASLVASWKVMSSEWFAKVAITVSFTDFQEIGALFLRKMYPVWDLQEFSSDLGLHYTKDGALE